MSVEPAVTSRGLHRLGNLLSSKYFRRYGSRPDDHQEQLKVSMLVNSHLSEGGEMPGIIVDQTPDPSVRILQGGSRVISGPAPASLRCHRAFQLYTVLMRLAVHHAVEIFAPAAARSFIRQPVNVNNREPFSCKLLGPEAETKARCAARDEDD
uniref:Uncharacterized protein n=1 Tax=Sphaerodactylus townsendi TaxID=933632 RepID=A0ACB8E856_9SAUR